MDNPASAPECIIAILGVSGAGKSTFINTICGREVCEARPSAESVTQKVRGFEAIVDGRRVMLIDTPGFNGTNVTDERLLEWIAEWLLGMTDPELQLNGIIILQPVENPRVLGTEKRMIQLLEAIIGPRFLSHVVVGFTMCDKGQSEDIKQSVEGRLATQYWGHLTSNGNVKCLQKDRPDLYPDTVRPLLQKEKALLLMQSELQTTDGSLFGTSAGQFLGRRLARYSARDTNASNELAASQATLRTTNSIAPMPLPINTSVTPQRIRNPNQPYNLSLRPSQSLAYHPNYSIQSSLGPPPIRSAITQPQAAPMGAGIPTQGPQRIQDVLKDLPRLLGLPVTHNGPKPHSRRALNNTTYLGSRSYNPLPNYPYPRNDFKNPTRYESRTDDNHAVSRRPSPGHSYDVDDSESDNDIEDKPTPEEARIRLQELQQMTVKKSKFSWKKAAKDTWTAMKSIGGTVVTFSRGVKEVKDAFDVVSNCSFM